MRATATVTVLLLGGACTGATGPGRGEGGHPQAAPFDNRPAKCGTIAVTSARVVSSCGTVGTDLTARFRHACDGRWRCALEGQLAPRVAAITESVTMPKSGRCDDASSTHKVIWRCEGTSGEHSLTTGAVARLRLSCPRPDAPTDDALGHQATQPVILPEPSAPGASQPGQGMAIRGRLIGSSLEEVAGRTIVVGNQRTSTDRHGRFGLGDVPAVYDLVVIEPDRALMVLYFGLSRRDPVMAHAELPHPAGNRRKHEAAITGRFWGDRLAGDRASVRFLPAEPSTPAYESDQSCGQNMEYSLAGLSWRGHPTLPGRLLAGIYTNCTSTDYIGPNCALAGIATKRLTLEDGDHASEDLYVIRPPVGHVAGTWEPAQDPEKPSLEFTYQLDDGAGSLFVARCPLAESFDCPLPDLRTLPGQYCASVVGKNDFPEVGSERFLKCGVLLGTTNLVVPGNLPRNPTPQPRPTPRLRPSTTAVNLTPPDTEELTIDSMFEWEPRRDSVYVVGLRPDMPFALVPRILVLTNQAGFRWSDLVAHGVGFPAGASYEVTVRSIPLASVDQVASLDWWYGKAPEVEDVECKGRRVTLVDPAARIPDPSSPSKVRELKDLPTALPACRSPIQGQVLSSNAFGKRVTVTGFLRCGIDSCDLAWPGRCSHACWLTDVAGSSLPIRLYRAHFRPGRKEIPLLPVAASGLLSLYPGPNGPTLEDANLCRTAASGPQGAR